MPRPHIWIMATLFTVTGAFLGQIGTAQTQAPKNTLTEQDARKLLVDSPWAKRTKMKSVTKEPVNLPEFVTPGSQPTGFGPGGPGHGYVPPTAEQTLNQTSGPQVAPCLGWGVGALALPSPTSEECKAAWQSIAVAKSAGLPQGSVLVLWESAEPVREAKSRLAISDANQGQPQDTIEISVIAHPLLKQINPSGSMKPMIRDSATLTRKGKGVIHAVDVVFVDTEDTIVRFYFPRAAIQPSDKELLFRLELQDTVVETKFVMAAMRFNGKVSY